MSHSYAQVLICQSTGVAVVGVYPILFPPNGYHGQLGWMANSCSLLGPQSYTALLNASQEGPLKLPRHIALKTSSGATINIGAALTTPSSKKLSAKLPLLSVSVGEEYTEVIHSSMKNDWRQQQSDEVEELTEMGEEEMEKDNNELGVSDGNAEENEEQAKVIGSDPLSRELYVEMQTGLTQDDLVAHFSSYGVIESVHCPSHLEGQAAVIFSTAGSVEHCLSVEHSLSPRCNNDTPTRGPILLRLKGGDGQRPAPSRQLQQNVNPFR